MTTTITAKIDDGSKRSKVRRLSMWEPDARYRHPVAAAAWCFTAGYLGELGVPPLAMAGLGVAAGMVGAVRAGRRWGHLDFGAQVENSMRAIALLAGGGSAVWLYHAGTTSPLRAAGWLVLAAAVLGGWYAVVRTSAPRRAAEVDAAEKVAEARAQRAAWADILDRAKLALEVVEIRDTRAGYVVAVAPAEGSRDVVPFAALQSRVPDLTTHASAVLARSGVTVRAGDIRVEETEAGHVHLIHVCTKRVETADVPYVPIERPTTIADPLDPGLYLDGQDVQVTFGGENGGQNAKIVGATGSGKSVLTNALIGRIGETVDCLVGVVATAKLVPLVYPWLKPWLQGRTDRPALDFVAGQNPQRVLEFLAAVYRYVCETNATLSNEATHRPTPQRPAMVVFVEEAGKAAPRKERVTTHDGRTVGFSELLSMICSEDRSAQVSVVMLNQSDLFDALGQFGPEIARNTPLRICLRTLTFSDGPSVLPALAGTSTDTTKLRNNTGLIQPSADEPRVMPFKAYRLSGDDVHAVAVRNAGWRPEMDARIAQALGEVWSGRWDAARLPELARAAERDGLTWPGDRRDPVEKELHAMIDEYRQGGEGGEPERAADPAAAGVVMPDVEQGIAELREITGRMGAQVLPDPLASVIRLLTEPQAPRDFITTRQLAILLGRVRGDASEDELKEAARVLGRELAAVDPEIRSEPRDRKQGYDVALLHRVARRLAGGGR